METIWGNNYSQLTSKETPGESDVVFVINNQTKHDWQVWIKGDWKLSTLFLFVIGCFPTNDPGFNDRRGFSVLIIYYTINSVSRTYWLLWVEKQMAPKEFELLTVTFRNCEFLPLTILTNQVCCFAFSTWTYSDTDWSSFLLVSFV